MDLGTKMNGNSIIPVSILLVDDKIENLLALKASSIRPTIASFARKTPRRRCSLASLLSSSST
jgi:hypothetical protein